MIGQPKPFASLSSTLLARKGTARPAMRPQGFGGFGALQTQDDLGWNDMGDPHDVHAHHEEQPAVPPVLMQREALQREMIGDDFDAPPVQPAPMFDSYEDEPEPELEEDYAPAIESVLAVKPVRAVETPVAALAVASSPVVAPPVAAPPVVVAPVAAVPVAAPSVANMVPVAVTLPGARGTDRSRDERQAGQGGVHAAARSRPSSAPAPGKRTQEPFRPATRHGGAGRISRNFARGGRAGEPAVTTGRTLIDLGEIR